MGKITFNFLLLITVSFVAFRWFSFSRTERRSITADTLLKAMPKVEGEIQKLHTKALLAKKFTQQKDFEPSFCFLIDMSLPANRKRFFVYDLKRDSILLSGLVAHGNCNQYWLEGRKYGNDMGCGCTSLGRYKVGNSYQGKFGLAFKLYGLDSSNSNAFKRYVVLHSHSCVPENETEENVCQSNGCPTVAPNFLKQIEPIIKSSKKPVLLWIFE